MVWEKYTKIRVLSDFENLFAIKEAKERPENLLIHIHGGGFISLSSGSH